jgi:beta-lactamase class A
MKVPILLAYLKWSELDSTLMNQVIPITKIQSTFDPYFKPSKTLDKDKSYSIKSLVEEMIIYSDNDAMRTLLEKIPNEIFDSVNKDLWIIIPNQRDVQDFLSVKDYATFFRILYNASYLNRTSSEYALDILSRSEFKDGLLKGLPPWIQVAHKFWERWFIDESNREKKQLHDCGIVYYEKYPYLVCIMTRWNDFAKLSDIIGQTSKIIFEEIQKSFP